MNNFSILTAPTTTTTTKSTFITTSSINNNNKLDSSYSINNSNYTTINNNDKIGLNSSGNKFKLSGSGNSHKHYKSNSHIVNELTQFADSSPPSSPPLLESDIDSSVISSASSSSSSNGIFTTTTTSLNNNNSNNKNNKKPRTKRRPKSTSTSLKKSQSFKLSLKQRAQQFLDFIVHTIKTSTIGTWIKLFIFICIIVGICLAVFVFKVQNHLEFLQKFVEKFGIGVGGVVFIGAFTLLIVFLIPVTIPTIIGGIIFKLWFGILFIWTASVIGGTISFLMGRYVFRKSIAKRIEKDPKLTAIDQAIGQEGWKIVLLLRLTPIVPESLLNYALSVTKIKFLHYIICTCIGLVPGVSFFVYVGSMIGNISEIGKKRPIQKSEIAMYVISAFGMVCSILFITIIVRRAVKKRLDNEESKGILDEEARLAHEEDEEEYSDDDDEYLDNNNDNIERKSLLNGDQ
eukprot:gene9273-11365_t